MSVTVNIVSTDLEKTLVHIMRSINILVNQHYVDLLAILVPLFE